MEDDAASSPAPRNPMSDSPSRDSHAGIPPDAAQRFTQSLRANLASPSGSSPARQATPSQTPPKAPGKDGSERS